MKLSSLHLEAFLALAKHLHFTNAAEEIHITQSAISQRISNLEEYLHVSLIIRDSNGIRLTDAGLQLLAYAQNQSHLENEMLSRIHGNSEGGVIRIGGPSSLMASVIIPELTKLVLTNSSLKLEVMAAELSELSALLRSGHINYAVTTLEENMDGIESLKIGVEKYVMVKQKNYKGPEIYLDHDQNDQTTYQYLKRFYPDKSSGLKRHFLGDIHGLLAGVSSGLGLAVLPIHLLHQKKNLKVIGKDKTLEQRVYLQYYKQSFYPKLHTLVVEKLKTISQRI